MTTYALTYPALQRRLIRQRRSRAFFSPRTAQHVRRAPRLAVRSAPVALEVARALVALGGAVVWAAVLVLLA